MRMSKLLKIVGNQSLKPGSANQILRLQPGGNKSKSMTKIYRTGAIGALLDIYEGCFVALKETIQDIRDVVLPVITDPHTEDENCRSIQTILTHVVYSGFGYATSIHNVKGSGLTRPDKTVHFTIQAYLEDLHQVFTYTESILNQLQDSDLEELDNALKIRTGWGQQYDIEQLMEHAIVHILRHHRQIEKMKRLLSQ